MSNKGLLQILGIDVKPGHEKEVDGMSNQGVIQAAINSASRGKKRDYFTMGLGIASFTEGFADVGAEVLERVFSRATTRNLDGYSVLEIAAGAGIAYLSIRSRGRKEAYIKRLATALNQHYVKD